MRLVVSSHKSHLQMPCCNMVMPFIKVVFNAGKKDSLELSRQFQTAFLIFKTYLPNPTHGVNQRHLEDYYRIFCRHPY